MNSLSRTYEDFWGRLIDQMHAQFPGWPTPSKPPSRNWLPLSAGIGWFSYGMSFGRLGLCSELFIRVPGDAAASEQILGYLHGRAGELEAAYGGTLRYEYLSQMRPGRTAARLADYRPGTVRDVNEHATYREWFLQSQHRLRDAIDGVGGLSALLDQALP